MFGLFFGFLRVGFLGAMIPLLTVGSLGGARPYRLAPGDTIEVSVSGIPDLKQRSTIGPDGRAQIPLVGALPIAGTDESELRATIQRSLSSRIYKQRTPEGRDNMVLISPDEVTVQIVEYRPAFITGDVARPGQQTYRPGLTVGQMIALAGGLDVMRFRMNNPFLESADYRAEHQTLWLDLARERAQQARLNVELAGRGDLDLSFLNRIPIGSQYADEISEKENSLLKVRRVEIENERKSLLQLIKKADDQLLLLSDQRAKEEEGLREDSDDYKRLQDLFQKGTTSMLRTADSRRVMLFSSTRLLQTTVQIAQTTRDREDLRRKLEKLDEERRSSVLRALQESTLQVEKLKARIEGVSEKLAYAGVIKSQLIRGSGAKPEIKIIRTLYEQHDEFSSSEDAAVMPGDLINISLRPTNPTQGIN